MKTLKIWLNKIYLFLFVRKPHAKPRKKRSAAEPGGFGQFTTIKSVLESLDSLFADIRVLRPKRREFQRLVKRYGPYICSLSHADDIGEGVYCSHLAEGYKAYGLPSFLINYRDKKWYHWKEDDPVSEFFIARKQTSFPFLKPKGICTCYECCFVGMLDGEPLELNFNILIDKTGNVTAYPYLAQIPRRFNGRVVSGKMGLYYPDLQTVNETKTIPQRKDHLIELFCINYNMVMSREASINIIVKKGKERATITVPPNRWKYFFKDREMVKTSSGRRKPIFHAVSSHHRHLSTGKISNVKTHYRGSRSFRWDGYSIKIILPGKHASAQASFGLAGEIVNQDKIDSGKYIDMGGKEMADKLNTLFEGE